MTKSAPKVMPVKTVITKKGIISPVLRNGTNKKERHAVDMASDQVFCFDKILLKATHIGIPKIPDKK